MNRLKRRCKKDNIICTISTKYLTNLYKKQNRKCFYTDIEIDWKTINGLRPNCLSIDKIIPEKGYIEGNVVLTIRRINSIKYDMTLDEMKKWTPDWHKRIMEFLK